jgi:cell division transport system permease protein
MRQTIRFLASVRFALVTAGQNLWRNRGVGLAAVSVMCLILLLLGTTLVLTHQSDKVLAYEQDHASNIKIFLVDGGSQAQINHFENTLRSDPRVRSLTFETKDQAAQDFQSTFGSDALNVLNTNPLPASVNLSLYNIADLQAINDEVGTALLVDHNPHASSTNFDPRAISNLQKLVSALRWGSLIFGAVLGFISVVIIMVTIRTAVAIRQREIEIMKLVGATDWFVRMPFIVEGVVCGVLASILSGVIVFLINRPMISYLRQGLPFFPFSEDTAYLGVIVIILLAGGVFLGAVGSLLGVRRFLAI